MEEMQHPGLEVIFVNGRYKLQRVKRDGGRIVLGVLYGANAATELVETLIEIRGDEGITIADVLEPEEKEELRKMLKRKDAVHVDAVEEA